MCIGNGFNNKRAVFHLLCPFLFHPSETGIIHRHTDTNRTDENSAVP